MSKQISNAHIHTGNSILQFYSLAMNSHNINLLQRIYSVYLKIHLFSFIGMHVLHLYIIQHFQRCLRTRKQRKQVLRSMI